VFAAPYTCLFLLLLLVCLSSTSFFFFLRVCFLLLVRFSNLFTSAVTFVGGVGLFFFFSASAYGIPYVVHSPPPPLFFPSDSFSSLLFCLPLIICQPSRKNRPEGTQQRQQQYLKEKTRASIELSKRKKKKEDPSVLQWWRCC
jgi:hypothetical protein